MNFFYLNWAQTPKHTNIQTYKHTNIQTNMQTYTHPNKNQTKTEKTCVYKYIH